MDQKIIAVKNLTKYFIIKGNLGNTIGVIKAVDDVSFTINKGEIFGLVGESGCGKTTLGKSIILLTKPSGGNILFRDNNLTSVKQRELKKLRQEMQIVYQNPFSSLNPKMKVIDLVGRPIDIKYKLKKIDRMNKVTQLLKWVGLNEEHLFKYPKELSGGQQQRIAIARAISIEPKFIVFDEPTSSLDVSIQAQIINLLIDLRDKLKLTYLFITHNLILAKHISDVIGIMYLGKIVEIRKKSKLSVSPKHPYTRALFSSIPIHHPKEKKQRILLKGTVPSPMDITEGCGFYSRCYCKKNICAYKEPKLIEIEREYYVACHLFK